MGWLTGLEPALSVVDYQWIINYKLRFVLFL
jgi:hypothetical protein